MCRLLATPRACCPFHAGCVGWEVCLGAALSTLAIVTLGVMTACSGLGENASGTAGAAGSHAGSVGTSAGHGGTVPSGGRPWLFAVELEAEDPLPGGQFVLVVDAGRSFDLG